MYWLLCNYFLSNIYFITESNFFGLEIGFSLSSLTVPVSFFFHFYHFFFLFSQIEYQCCYVAWLSMFPQYLLVRFVLWSQRLKTESVEWSFAVEEAQVSDNLNNLTQRNPWYGGCPKMSGGYLPKTSHIREEDNHQLDSTATTWRGDWSN